MKIVGYHSSEDPDIECSRCGRWVKRAVDLAGAPVGLYGSGYTFGLDCAAVLMGRPKSKQTYADIEARALKAQAAIDGTRAGTAARAVLGVAPSKKAVGWAAYSEIVQRAFARFSLPAQASNPWFQDAFMEAWQRKS